MASVGRPLGDEPAEMGPVAPFGFAWAVVVWLRKPPQTGVGFPWISLDSLVRNETYQWVTRETRRKIFAVAFSLQASRAGMAAQGLACGRAGSRIRASLIQFLIFCKRLSFDRAVPPAASLQKQRALGRRRAPALFPGHVFVRLALAALERQPVDNPHGSRTIELDHALPLEMSERPADRLDR